MFSWIDVIKVFVAGTTTFAFSYMLKPLFLLGRDYALWAYIDRKVITKELRVSADRHALAYLDLTKKYTHLTSIEASREVTRYYIGDTEVYNDEYCSYVSSRNRAIKRFYKEKDFLNRRAILLNGLIRHYDQNENSLIENIVEECIERSESLTVYAEPYRIRGIN
ncbi:hypothetical protein [Halomonas litopenaei]|uniref:hypothetical protein n=1 Tax=Halomonas litopenaei TaxID=2109328 RepID=UPI001A8EFB6F|nr:hypothetical protein [Halomonas litopenaei]MBN8410683.1 hypothetical protein [Halomonas litopenaei]